jgi:hypothetical protein
MRQNASSVAHALNIMGNNIGQNNKCLQSYNCNKALIKAIEQRVLDTSFEKQLS